MTDFIDRKRLKFRQFYNLESRDLFRHFSKYNSETKFKK